MSGKRARKIRKMIDCDLSKGSDDKAQGYTQVDERHIAVIDGVNGNHSVRTEEILEVRTTEERYLYRQLKKVYNDVNKDPETRKQLVSDLQAGKAGTEEK